MKQAPAADQVAAEIERTLQTLRDHADTDELKRLRRLLRKQVPFFLRSYFYAFLLQRLLGTAPAPVAGGGRRESRGRDSRGRGSRNGRASGGAGVATADAAARPEPASAAAGQSEDDLRRLFISIGRNRRVQTKDLTTLIAENVSISEDQLGRIKILDNYSFVEVPEAIAQQVIDQISGSTFKGRKLTVDFARSRG